MHCLNPVDYRFNLISRKSANRREGDLVGSDDDVGNEKTRDVRRKGIRRIESNLVAAAIYLSLLSLHGWCWPVVTQIDRPLRVGSAQ